MKKNTGSPKKRPKKRHKKKQLKNRQRSLRQRLARLSTLRQALAATRAMSASHSPVAEPEPDEPLPTMGGKLLWDVTINSVDAPHHFSTQPQLPPKSPDWVIIRLPAPATPLPVDAALCRQPTALRLRPSTWVLVLVLVSEQPPKPPTQRHRLFPSLCSPPLTIVTPYLPQSKHLEKPRQQTSPQDWPQLPRSHPTGRRVSVPGALKHLKPTVMADSANSDEPLTTDVREKSVHYKLVNRKFLKKNKIKSNQATKPFKKKAGFIRKAFRPNEKRLSRKSIGSLKRERLGLSSSSQSRRYFMKVPCLSRVSGKVLLTQSVKLLASEIKQHSELVTPVLAAELLTKQQPSLRYYPIEAPLKLGKPAVINDNATSAEQVSANDEVSVDHEVIFRKRPHKNLILNQATLTGAQNSNSCDLNSDYFTAASSAAVPSILGHSHAEVPLKTEQLANNAIREGHLPSDNEESVHYNPVSKIYFRVTKIKVSQTANSSDTNSDQSTLVSPVEKPMRQDPSLASPAEKPLSSVYPAVITDQLQRVEEVFDKRDVKHHFRKSFELRKTTAGREWEFREAESLFLRLFRRAPRLKKACLKESGCVPEEIFRIISTEIAQYNQPLTQQDHIMRVIWDQFFLEMANFNQLVQSLAASGPTEPGTLESPADPPCETVTTSLFSPHLGRGDPIR